MEKLAKSEVDAGPLLPERELTNEAAYLRAAKRQTEANDTDRKRTLKRIRRRVGALLYMSHWECVSNPVATTLISNLVAGARSRLEEIASRRSDNALRKYILRNILDEEVGSLLARMEGGLHKDRKPEIAPTVERTPRPHILALVSHLRTIGTLPGKPKEIPIPRDTITLQSSPASPEHTPLS